jgi:hypothetical protein
MSAHIDRDFASGFDVSYALNPKKQPFCVGQHSGLLVSAGGRRAGACGDQEKRDDDR